MTFFLICVFVLLAALLAVHIWLGNGEDLSVYDHPVEECGFESFSNPAGPSTGHQGVVTSLKAKRPEIDALSSGGMISWVREFMESMARGKELDARFVPQECNGVPCEWVLAPGCDPARRVLYFHGGAFFAGSPVSHRSATTRYSQVANAAVLSVDYRLLPENKRKDGIEDCQNAYRWLLENGPEGASPVNCLFVGGDSAGGNLALVISAWARDSGLKKPDAVVALSPVTDSTFLAPSIRENAEKDTLVKPLFGPLLRAPRFMLRWITAGITRARPVNPSISPVFGDLSGLPPTLLQASDTEMLFDDARRYVNKARAAGSPVFLQTWSGLLHAWQLFYPEVPEAGQAWKEIQAFLQSVEDGEI